MKLLLALTVLLTSGLANAVTLDDELIQKAKEGARNFGKNLLKHKFPPEDLVNVTNRELQGSDFTSFPILAEFFGGEPGFYHSVASGSPLEDGIILWTRYTPRAATDVVVIEYRMAKVDPGLPFEAHLDPLANPDLLRGTILTDGSIDWVVKLDVRGLDSYTDYVFAFVAEGKVSDVGQTRTAPSMGDNVEKLRYAVFSCSNYPSAYFHSYDLASTIRNLDLW
jgi:alkaline phosphatase D